MNSNITHTSDSAPSETDGSLAELLTLTREVDADGTIRYRNSKGERHRVWGPAVIRPNGDRYWFHEGNPCGVKLSMRFT